MTTSMNLDWNTLLPHEYATSGEDPSFPHPVDINAKMQLNIIKKMYT